MLALATHEVHFSILREDVLLQEQQSRSGSASGNGLSKLQLSGDSGPLKSRETKSLCDKPYEFLHIWILREYLELDLMITNLPNKVEFDLERAVDDFIFICFFAGNDFLPHMPTLLIHEGAIDLLLTVYKEEFNNLGGYLVDMQRVDQKKASYIKLSRVEKFILKVGTHEEKIFKKRSEILECKLRRILRDCTDNQDEEAATANYLATLSLENLPSISSRGNSARNDSDILGNTKELKERSRKIIRAESDLFKNGSQNIDKVRFGTIGWKGRYYKQKFSVESPEDVETMRRKIVSKYTEGLLWVLLYYFSGVPSWTWFYPYHYGPFASDLRGISQLNIKFEKGLPFKPFDQLMSVLPPMSASALPKGYQALMTDEHSRIIDFYPIDSEVDTDGKRYMSQGVMLLPFIEEERLLIETRLIEKELTEEEATRNGANIPQLFVRSSTDNSKDDVSCVIDELPRGHSHVPRLLEGVVLPDKTVFENDIMETELWHEQSRRPITRMHFQERERKERNRLKFTSTNSSSTAVMYKEAGSGMSARGRGQPQLCSQEFSGANVKPSAWGRSASSSYGQNIMPANYQGASRQGTWQAVGSNRYEPPKGTKDFRTSDPTQSSWSSGRARMNVNNNFWPSRNEVAYDRHHSSRRDSGIDQAPFFGQGHTSRQHGSMDVSRNPWQNRPYMSSSSKNTSQPPQGRGTTES